jgi:polyferredoxin
MSVRWVPRRSAASARTTRWSRHTVQAVTAAFVVVVVWRKAAGEAGAASGEAFCPFGGYETAFTAMTTGRTVAHVHPANLVLASIVVVLALALRGAFCGWLCPLGSLQEAVHAASRAVVDRVPPLRRARRRWDRGEHRVLRRVDHAARYGRYLVLAFAVGGAALTGVMVFREYDPWSALLSIVEFEISLGLVVLIVMLVMSLVVPRPFCRYACPLGATIGLIGKASPVAVQRDADACLGCDLCSRACPMGLEVHTATRVTDALCVGCLECVAACPSREALGVRVSLPMPAVRPHDLPVPPVDIDAPVLATATTSEGAVR